MRLLLLACALVAMLAPGLAHAEPPMDRPLTGVRYSASLIAAAEFWHATPDCEVRFYEATTDELVDWLGPGTGGGVRGVQRGDVCPIWLGPLYLSAGVRNRVVVCTIVGHEDGHLLGFPHSDDDRSLMWPVLNRVTWPCVHRFVPRHKGVWWRETYGTDWATRPG